MGHLYHSYFPGQQTNIAIENGPVEIVDLPIVWGWLPSGKHTKKHLKKKNY